MSTTPEGGHDAWVVSDEPYVAGEGGDSRATRRRGRPGGAGSWPTRTAVRERRGAGGHPGRGGHRPPKAARGTSCQQTRRRRSWRSRTVWVAGRWGRASEGVGQAWRGRCRAAETVVLRIPPWPDARFPKQSGRALDAAASRGARSEQPRTSHRPALLLLPHRDSDGARARSDRQPARPHCAYARDATRPAKWRFRGVAKRAPRRHRLRTPAFMRERGAECRKRIPIRTDRLR